jgi:hypothetical protein
LIQIASDGPGQRRGPLTGRVLIRREARQRASSKQAVRHALSRRRRTDILPIQELTRIWTHIAQALVASIGALAFIFAFMCMR